MSKKNSVSKHVYITKSNFEALTTLCLDCNRSRSFVISKFISYVIDHNINMTRSLTLHDRIFSPYLTIKNECFSTLLCIPKNILKRCEAYYADYFKVCSFSYFLNHLIARCIGCYGRGFWISQFINLKPSSNKFDNFNQVNYRKVINSLK